MFLLFCVLCIAYSLARSPPHRYVSFLFIICWLWCAWASKDSFWIERHVSSIKKKKRAWLKQNKTKKSIFVFVQQGQSEEHTEIATAIFGTSFKCYNPFVCLRLCMVQLLLDEFSDSRVNVYSSMERMEKKKPAHTRTHP